MMNLNNFIYLFVLSLFLISVQSSNSNPQQFGNETLRHKTFEWKTYVCNKSEVEKLKIQYVVIHNRWLYIYFEKYVVSVKRVEIFRNYLRRKEEPDLADYFISYGDFQYALYREMDSDPALIAFEHTYAFFNVKTKDGWQMYILNNRTPYPVILAQLIATLL